MLVGVIAKGDRHGGDDTGLADGADDHGLGRLLGDTCRAMTGVSDASSELAR